MKLDLFQKERKKAQSTGNPTGIAQEPCIRILSQNVAIALTSASYRFLSMNIRCVISNYSSALLIVLPYQGKPIQNRTATCPRHVRTEPKGRLRGYP